MLPSYPPSPPSVIAHIHLGAVPYDGSPPSGFDSDNAPPYKIFHVFQDGRIPHYEGLVNFARSWNGTPFEETIRTSDNVSPIVFNDLEYKLRVSNSDLDVLRELLFRRVYLVDSRHIADGFDHSPYVRIMWFAEMDYQEAVDPVLNYNTVRVVFKDMNTVSPE